MKLNFDIHDYLGREDCQIWEEFAGPDDFMNRAQAGRDAGPDLSVNGPGGGGLNPDFYGTPDIETALDLARNGWPDAPRLAPEADKLGFPRGSRVDCVHDVTGAFVDVGRYLEGHPECMVDFAEVEAPRIVRIAVGLATPAIADKETMIRRGSVALAIADTLAVKGIQTQIDCFYLTQARNPKGIHAMIFPVKRAGQLADENQLAFWLAHPSALRRFGFGAMEAQPPRIRQQFGSMPGRGYGAQPKPHRFADYDVTIAQLPESDRHAREIYEQKLSEINELDTR